MVKVVSKNYFVCTIQRNDVAENGETKAVKEQYVVDAESFTEAEACITKEFEGTDDFKVVDISRAPFGDVAFLDEEEDVDRFFKVKVKFITIDEKSEKEKTTTACYLVQSGSTSQAQKVTDEMLGGMMIDYSISSIIETKILEVYMY